MTSAWTRTRLGAAFATVTGSTPSKANASLYGTYMPLVKPPELLDRPLDSAEDGLSESGTRFARTLPVESVLVSCIGNLGKVGLNTVPVAFNQQINAVLPDRDIAIPEFIFYQALSPAFKAQLESLATGTTVRIVNKSKFNEIEIVLAPLLEQRRIVAILDEVFEGIATAKANAEKNLQNARELFDSFVGELFSRVGDSCGRHRLGDIVKRLTNGFVGPTRDIYVKKGVPYLLARHVRDNRLTFDGRTFVRPDFNEKHRKSKLKRGDVLLVQSGHIGHTAVVGTDHEGHNCHAMIVMTPVDGVLVGEYLSYFFNSPEMRLSFESIRSGSTVPHLTCGAVRELGIPLPPVDDQRRLVCQIDELESEVSRLRNLTEAKSIALDELRKSLLHQAFTGAMTAKTIDKQVAEVA